MLKHWLKRTALAGALALSPLTALAAGQHCRRHV